MSYYIMTLKIGKIIKCNYPILFVRQISAVNATPSHLFQQVIIKKRS